MGKTRSLHWFIRLSGHSRWWAGVCVTGLLTTELGAGGLGRLTAALETGNGHGHVAAGAEAGAKTDGNPGSQPVLRDQRGCVTSKKRNTRPRHHRVRLHRHAHLVVDVCVTELPTTGRSNAPIVRPAAASGSVVRRSGASGKGRAVVHRPVPHVKQKQRSPRQPQAAQVAVPTGTQEQVAWQRPQSGTGQARVLVAARPDPAISTSPVAVYGRVKPTSAATLPTGQVCFYDGRSLTTLGCSTLAPQANGVMQAHIKVTLAKGTHVIVARYSGDARYAAVQSSAFALAVS